jgi:hypothetical protein
MDAQSDAVAPGEQRTPGHGIPGPGRPWLAGGALLVVVAALVVVSAVRGGAKLPSTVAVHTLPRTPTSVVNSWPLYRDPAGLFTVRIPPGWTASTNTGTATVGDTTATGQETEEETALGDPRRGSTTITVYVSVSEFNSPFLHALACREGTPRPTNATVAGLPAVYNPRTGWVFDTDQAFYQVGYLFPGYTGSIPQASAPTPIPAATLQAGEQLMNQILATFVPSTTQPLTC